MNDMENGIGSKLSKFADDAEEEETCTEIERLQEDLNKLIPNLPDPLNFVPFGTMRYSPFDINLTSLTCILFVYLYFCLFLNKA